MARGGALNLGGAAVSQVVVLAVTVVLARWLGRTDVGRYAQCLAFLALLGLLSLSGLRAGMTRFVAVHLTTGDVAAVRGTVRAGLALTACGASVLAVGLFLAAPVLGRDVFHDSALVVPLRLVAVALPASAFTDAALAATQGFGTMKPFALIGLIAEPLVRIALTFGALAAGGGLRGAVTALVASTYLAALLAAAALHRLLPGRGPASAQLRRLYSFSVVSWVASLATTGLIWADTILLGALRNSADVGVYNVATRLVALATFVMVPINQAFSPRIATLHESGNRESLGRAYEVATSWIVRLSMPAFVALLVFPHDLLALFGQRFGAAAAVTVILAVGKLVDAGTGPCSLMLTMTGRPALNMVDNVAVLALNIGLNLMLIPRYGLLGAAIAWAVSLAVVNVARVVQVWLACRMLPFGPSTWKGVVAAIVALAVGFALRASLPAGVEILLGLPGIVVVYLAALFALGFSADDRMVLGSLARPLRTAAP